MAPHRKESLNRNFFDLLSTFKQISGDSVQKQLLVQRVEVPEYLTLYSPAINWILQCIAYRAPEVHSRSVYRNLLIYSNCNDDAVFMLFVFSFQPLLTEMMERCKKLGNKWVLL